MAHEITRIDDAILYVRISGVMKLADEESLHTAGMQLITQGKKLRLLVTLENFQGLSIDEDWSNVGFLIAHGNDIVKIAFVGDDCWKDEVFAFVGKGLRTTEIEFFPANSAKEAENWIQA